MTETAFIEFIIPKIEVVLDKIVIFIIEINLFFYFSNTVLESGLHCKGIGLVTILKEQTVNKLIIKNQ